MILENINALCRERGINIYTLEKATRIGNGTISRWDKCSPRLSSLQTVADYFGVTVIELLSGPAETAGKDAETPAPVSGPIEDFLTHLRSCEQHYHMAEADEQEAAAATNDIQHDLELVEHTDEEVLLLGRELIGVRRKRRRAKDCITQTAPVLAWLEDHRQEVKSLERLLGDARKAERSTENRIYTPRRR